MFAWHHITPMQFYKMGEGEKKIIYAFVRYEIEQRMKESERIESLFRK